MSADQSKYVLFCHLVDCISVGVCVWLQQWCVNHSISLAQSSCHNLRFYVRETFLKHYTEIHGWCPRNALNKTSILTFCRTHIQHLVKISTNQNSRAQNLNDSSGFVCLCVFVCLSLFVCLCIFERKTQIAVVLFYCPSGNFLLTIWL